MLFSYYDRYQYAVNPLVEVICQLRFPAILSISAKEPAAFQEAVRRDFPRYLVNHEQPAPKVTGLGTPNARLEQGAPITNYSFISADGLWKPDQQLYRPVHPPLSALGRLRPAAGQAPGRVHPDLPALLLRADRPQVRQRLLPQGPEPGGQRLVRPHRPRLPGHPGRAGCGREGRGQVLAGRGDGPGGLPAQAPRRPRPSGRRQEGPGGQVHFGQRLFRVREPPRRPGARQFGRHAPARRPPLPGRGDL